MALYKINTSLTVYIEADDEFNAEQAVVNELESLMAISEDYEQVELNSQQPDIWRSVLEKLLKNFVRCGILKIILKEVE